MANPRDDRRRIQEKIDRAQRDVFRDQWTPEKWRAVCEKIAAMNRADRDFNGLLEHELALYREGRLDLVVQSIRERMTTSFARAAEVYRDWKDRQPTEAKK